MEGNKEVDKIMIPLREHIKDGSSHYNRIYEAVWKLTNKIQELKKEKK